MKSQSDGLLGGKRVPTRKTVLFLAYLFPPTGGGGVQRSLKFVKYLPQTGWQPIVISVRPISYYVYDSSLLKEVPSTVVIYRTHSLDPLRVSSILLGDARRATAPRQVSHPVYSSNSRLTRAYRAVRPFVLFPDAQWPWIPFVFWRGLKLIRKHRPSVIYSPTAPYSSAIAAYLLSAATGIPYVLDFRDGWTDDAYHHPPTRFHRMLHRKLEKRVVTRASHVCVYGRWLGERLASRYPSVANRITEITNGFDPEDATGSGSIAKAPGKRRIVYSGSLFSHHREVFNTALTAISQVPAEILKSLEVLVVGQAFEGAAEQVERLGLTTVVKLKGYLPHAEALAYLQSADATLLLVRRGDVASVTGKVFELMMVQAPIWALAEPSGECARILRMAGADAWLTAPDDVEGALTSLLGLFRAGFPRLTRSRVEVFSRVSQTQSLANVLDLAANGS